MSLTTRKLGFVAIVVAGEGISEIERKWQAYIVDLDGLFLATAHENEEEKDLRNEDLFKE